MIFFYSNNGETLGPVSKEDLKGKITRDTLVWFNGLSKWEKASEIPELFSIFENTPPPLPSMEFNNNSKSVNVKIIKDSHKIFNAESKVKLAREIKFNSILVILSLSFGLISSIIYYQYKSEDYEPLKLELSRYSNIPSGNIISNEIESERFDKMIEFSQRLNCYPSETYYGLDIVPKIYDLIEVNLKYIFEDAIKFGLNTFIILIIILFIGRYFIKSAKWVSDKAG